MYPYDYDEKSNDVIQYAFAEARDMGHRFVGTEHLILGLSQIEGTKVTEIFKQNKIAPEDIRLEIIKRLGREASFKGIEDYTRRAKTCLEKSHAYAMQTNASEIIPEHIFVSIMHDSEALGYQILMTLRMDIRALMQELLEDAKQAASKTKKIIKRSDSKKMEVHALELEANYEEKPQGILNKITVNLTELAKEKPFETLVGRENEVDRMLQILSRKNKNNVCLVGEPGVGKTALVHGLANKIAQGMVPEVFKNKAVIEVNVGALVAGTMFRGQFEERMNELIEALLAHPNWIVFFDEFHHLMGIGATGDKSLDAIGMLKPHLSNGTIQLIGATTYKEYEKYIQQDQALSRRLTTVAVEEPSEEVTLSILNAIKASYEQHHKFFITDQAMDSAVKLSKRYLPERKFPDKAIDLIDEACSRKRLEHLGAMEVVDELRYRLNQLKSSKEEAIIEMDFTKASKIMLEEKQLLNSIERNEMAKSMLMGKVLYIEANDVQSVISDWTQIPVTDLTFEDKQKLIGISKTLEQSVFGQSEAIDVVSRALKRARVGMGDPQKPMGVFLFVGPTGVGKTELCRNIAKAYFGHERHMIKLDMSEYMERHSVSKLIGSPPGYEGNREGGLLTNAIEKMPFSVVVFDEIEKAHEDVVNVLLQLMDEGHLKDGRGKQVHFKDALIIMTSNLGAGDAGLKTVGFGSDRNAALNIKETCKKYFKPEFINRVSEIVVFSPLSQMALREVAKLEIKKLSDFLSTKAIKLEVTDACLTYLVERYLSEAYGARPLLRGIENEMRDVIADLLLSDFDDPETIGFDCDESGLYLISK